MNDDITSDGKAASDEKSTGSGKLDSMSNEELIKLVKNQFLLKKKLEIKINELITSNTSLTQTEDQLRHQLDAEQSKYSKLIPEFDQNKLNQSKLQEELHSTRESLEYFQLENETLKTSCQNFQNEISVIRSESEKCSFLSNLITITIDLFQLPISLPDVIDNEFIQIYKNECEQKQDNFKQTFEQIEQDKTHLQQRIEDLEFFNEEIKLEIDDLRLKSSKYQQDKQLMEKEIDNYRRQIEDFEEQFLELQRESHQNHLITYDKSQQQPSLSTSLLTLHQTDENLDEIILQCMNYILHQIDDQNHYISKASSTSSLLLSSDIPTLLHSIGIINSTDDEFSVPLNFESVLRLCTLLIERCRVLQYILLKNNDISMNLLTDNDYDNNNAISFLQNNHFEQCKILIHKQDHIALDTLFERIYTGMNQTISSNNWQIIIEKPIDQKTSPYIRLKFDDFKFISEEIEDDLIRLRSQLDQLSKQNEEQQHEIQRLRSNKSYEKLKQRQTELEEQLAEQSHKITILENIIKQENIDKIKLDQLQQIELAYNQLQEKYHIAEQLEDQLKRQNDLAEKLKTDYDHQHFHLLDRDENIRLLKLELEQHEHLREKYENRIKTLQIEFEQEKLSLLSTTQNQDESYSLISKQQQELKDLIQIKQDESQNLSQANLQLENNLKQNQQLILDKNKQIDDLQNQLQFLNINHEEFQMKLDQIKEEKNKFLSEIHLLMNKITILEKEKSEFIQSITDLKEQLTINNNNTAIDQEYIHVEQTNENLKHDLEFNEIIELKQSTNDIDQTQTMVINTLQSELETIRQENENLNKTINELNMKTERQISDSDENIQDLKEKYQKMKILLTRLRKELQDKNQQPKQSLIDLELADYEKTIKNLKDDLINKDKEIQDLRDELSNSTEKYACLKLEIENVEQQKLQAEQRANKFKALLDVAKKELQNAKDLELERHHNDDHIRVLIEKSQNELDSNKILISELLNEKQQLTEKINNQNETNQRTNNLLGQNLRIAKHDLEILKQDYDTLQDDFNSYKIRAQSVLKQQQSNQRERTPSLADKQSEYEEIIEKLKTTLRETNDKIQLLMSENEVLQKEQDRFIEIQTKSTNESKKREQDLRKQHQVELDKIENDCLQRTNDSYDTVKTVTLQNEALSTAFKEQIATIESEHERSTLVLQEQIQTFEQEIEQLKTRIEFLQQTNIDNEKLTSNSESSQIGINNHLKRDDTLAWSDSEHQQVEGMVSANIDHQPPDITIKKLENIIIDENSTNTPSTPNDKPRQILSEDSELERQRLEEELNKIKSQLITTTELFNESELNNVRLNEQVALLKDEIRRIERNMDRADSISNLEYLKNVILKFFILKSTPERLQLIPVLVTMLKLSPDEQAQLVRVANLPTTIDENLRSNESSTQPMTNGPNSPSWGSYLNMW